jgi:hypothetical protein
MKIPSKLRKILDGLPPCQEKQISTWYHSPQTIEPFIFCKDHACEECILHKATMITKCPYCGTSVATTVVVAKNGFTLCRVVQCVCRQQFRVVFCDIFCNSCKCKAQCLSVPTVKPVVRLHEKIK